MNLEIELLPDRSRPSRTINLPFFIIGSGAKNQVAIKRNVYNTEVIFQISHRIRVKIKR